MEQTGNIGEEVAELASRIIELVGEANLPPISAEIAREVEEKKKAGICLNCGETKKESYKRGLCDACYQAARRLHASGLARYAQMERRGMIATAEVGGRPPKVPGRFRELLAEKRASPQSAKISPPEISPAENQPEEKIPPASDEPLTPGLIERAGKAAPPIVKQLTSETPPKAGKPKKPTKKHKP